jgi:hypothetical protein
MGSHAAELLTLEPARTNDGSEWECQLCTVLSAAGESSYRMCRAPLVSVPPVRCRHLVQPFSRWVLGLVEKSVGGQHGECAVHQRCLMAKGTRSCASCTLEPRRAGVRLHRIRRGVRGRGCGRRGIDERFGEMVGAGRSRPLTPAGCRRETGRAAAAEARCILLYVALARVVLYGVFGDLGGRLTAPRLRRRVGVDIGVVRGVCVVGLHMRRHRQYTL